MYPDAEEVTIIPDNLNTHTLSSLQKRHPESKALRISGRLRLVHTPVHGSWLNLAENQISIISRQCLTGRIADMMALRAKMRNWIHTRNAAPKPTMWKFSKAKARKKTSSKCIRSKLRHDARRCRQQDYEFIARRATGPFVMKGAAFEYPPVPRLRFCVRFRCNRTGQIHY